MTPIDGNDTTMARTVGEVAALASITVRTLHHYDQIGLVEPSGRSDAGYRLYEDEDLERLWRVLYYRELGFGLDEIRDLLADPTFDRRAALVEQRKLLGARAAQVDAMIAAVDAAIDAHDRGTTMTDEMFEVFRDFDPTEHEEEVSQRWGDTDAYRQSHQRTARYTKQDWQEIKNEADAVADRFAAVFRDGAAPDSDEAMDAAEAHRQHLHRFYDCAPSMHVALGEMYVADARFTAYWDDREPGLAPFVRDAIAANAARMT